MSTTPATGQEAPNPSADEITYDTVTPDSGVHETFNALSPEEQEKQREEWKSELVKTEEEIQTLRQVLNSKVKHAQDLKRRLGITVWREFTDDFNASMKSVRESQTLQTVQSSSVYQKTAGAMGAVGEKTAGLFGGISAKFGAIKENPTFKSFEERVGGVVASAKGQQGEGELGETAMGSGSNSTQDFNQMQEGDKTGMEANGQTTLAGTDINQPAS